MDSFIEIIITDDNKKWRNAMREILLGSNIKIIAEAADGIELLKLLETQNPDVILLDLAMPNMDGTETMHWLTELHPKKKVIVMSLFDEPTLMNDYIMRGVRGCISKSDVANNTNEFINAIKVVSKGKTYFNFDRNEIPLKLSIRQKELITMFADHKPTTEIAAELKLTKSAVDKQKKKIMNVFGVESLPELLKQIYSLGLNYFRRPPKKGH